MTRTPIRLAVALSLPLTIATLAWAQGTPPAAAPAAQDKPAVKPLSIGDTAPAFDIAEWVQGAELAEFPAGKVSVLEFWATWCGPCKVSIPHLSEMNDRFKDYGVTFIGVSDEPLETVKGFLGKDDWKSKMRYTVATDPDRSTHTSYMTAAGQSGIPTAFVIGKKGTIEWIGHPDGLDEVLEQVVHDKWDSAAFKAKFDQQMAAANAMRAAMADIRAAGKAGDWEKVVSLYDGLLAKHPDDVGLQMSKMMVLLTKANKPDAGYALAKQIFAANKDNAMALNDLAWTIIDNPGIEKRDVAFATEVASTAAEASKWKNAAIIDTLARCHWEKGDKAKAIELQKKAIAVEGSGPMATGLKKTLEEYEGAQKSK